MFLLGALLLPALFIACDDDDDEVLVPTVTLTPGEVTEHTATFTVETTNAERCAYLYVEDGTPLTDANKVLETGVKVDPTVVDPITIESLKDNTTYNVVAAAANSGYKVLSEVWKFTTPKDIFTFATADGEMYSSYADVYLTDAEGKYKLSLDFNADFSEKGYLPEGTYTVGSADDFYIDPEISSLLNLTNDEENYLKSGSVKVTITKEKKYHFDINVVLDNDKTFEAEFEGDVKNMEVIYQMAISEANFKAVNDQKPGEYYVYMHDADWNFELYVDFFDDPASKTLSAGTYKFSNDKAPGTFGPLSNLQIYTPYTNNYITGGEVEVKLDGDTYTLNLKLVGENGREMAGTYTGAIK